MDYEDANSSTDHATDESSVCTTDVQSTSSSRFQSIHEARDAEALHVKNEDEAVRLSKWLVIVVLVTAAATLGTFAFVSSRRNELAQFENQVRKP